MRFAKATVILLALLGALAATMMMVVNEPQLAVYVSIITVGLALAWQKYLASFFSFFSISFTRIYDVGDRIRIGSIKGDVRRIGLFHTTLEEVGEDEKLGGELTGRIIHVPNLVVMDQPVLNYSKDYSRHHGPIASDFLFDEVRIPITTTSNVDGACVLLESIIKNHDEAYIKEASQVFKREYPKFLDEANIGPRVLVHVEPQRIWIKGKFVAPVKGRNELRSKILRQFFREVNARSDIKLA